MRSTWATPCCRRPIRQTSLLVFFNLYFFYFWYEINAPSMIRTSYLIGFTGATSLFMPSSLYTAMRDALTEYSSVKTTSSGTSQNCPVKPRLTEFSGTITQMPWNQGIPGLFLLHSWHQYYRRSVVFFAQQIPATFYFLSILLTLRTETTAPAVDNDPPHQASEFQQKSTF